MKTISTLVSAFVLAHAVFAQSFNQSTTASTTIASGTASLTQSTTLAPAATTPATPAVNGTNASANGAGNTVQPSGAPSASAPASLIPQGISDQCQTFLNTLNNDPKLSTCLSTLLSATSAFSPSNAQNQSKDKVSDVLSEICSAQNACPDALVRGYVTQLNTQCQDELTEPTPNKLVQALYDSVYIANPLRSAACAKDSTTGAYCALQFAQGKGKHGGSEGNTANALVQQAASDFLSYPTVDLASFNDRVSRRAAPAPASNKTAATPNAAPAASSSALTLLPNATSYRTTSLPYLFVLPDLDAPALCTPCTQSVLASYVAWENLSPHALGLANSPMLGGQAALWSSVNTKCGDPFMGTIMNLAGTSAIGTANAASPRASVGSIGVPLLSAAAVVIGWWAIAL